MKQKIKSALEQGYKNLGVGDEAFERVATLGETFIKEEGQIADFVKKAEGTLKLYQSEADRIRTELNGKIKTLEGEKANLEAKLKEGVEKQEVNDNVQVEEQKQGQGQDASTLVEQLSAMFEAKIKPLQDELAKFKGEQSAKQALIDAEETFKSNGWVKKYKDEANDAWERAVEINEATGSKMTAQELSDKALSYFSKAVERRGDDISQPFKSEGGAGGDDTSKAKEIIDLLKGNS